MSRIYHVIINGEKTTITPQEKKMIDDKQKECLLDIDWYIADGGVLLSEFI